MCSSLRGALKRLKIMASNYMDIAFGENAKAEQERLGSREAYQRMADKNPDQSRLSIRETQYISQRDSFYLSTVGENGWPYVQFRGGPRGFLKVIDESTLAFADFRGNMQYISTGNMKANGKAALILLDYPTRTRVKIWAETELVEASERPDLLEKLIDPDYEAQVERIMIFHIKAFNWNCPQHITPKFTFEEMKAMVRENPELMKALLADDSSDAQTESR